jgi:hypothetical protein
MRRLIVAVALLLFWKLIEWYIFTRSPSDLVLLLIGSIVTWGILVTVFLPESEETSD